MLFSSACSHLAAQNKLLNQKDRKFHFLCYQLQGKVNISASPIVSMYGAPKQFTKNSDTSVDAVLFFFVY